MPVTTPAAKPKTLRTNPIVRHATAISCVIVHAYTVAAMNYSSRLQTTKRASLRTRGLRLRVHNGGPGASRFPDRRRNPTDIALSREKIRTVSKLVTTEVDHAEVDFEAPADVVQSAFAAFNPLAQWSALPSRFKLLFATGIAFVICNMDKVNMSVAIIPMAREFGWSATVSGFVQSAFFYGFMLFQLPGGFLNTKFSGARMLPIGVAAWSTATCVVPMLGSSIAGLCASRAVVGVGEAVAPASLTDMVASVVPVTERSRSMTFVGSALYVGSLIGLLWAPIIVERLGWPFVFYVFGGVGLIWSLWWTVLLRKVQENDPQTYSELIENRSKHAHKQQDVPWRGMLRCRPLHALIYTHFCQNWFHYAVLAWLPSYFTDTLSLDLTRASQMSLIPPAAGISAALVAGPMADNLIAKGWKIGVVRKLAQCTAFLGPMVCLMAASYPPFANLSVILITIAQGFSSFALAGLCCNHQDLSPTYSSLLMGFTNTAGALTGLLGVSATGVLLDLTGSWALALFAPSIFFYITGSIVFVLFGSGERADFSNNAPFAIEKLFRKTEQPS